jgi:hypothetical protein
MRTKIIKLSLPLLFSLHCLIFLANSAESRTREWEPKDVHYATLGTVIGYTLPLEENANDGVRGAVKMLFRTMRGLYLEADVNVVTAGPFAGFDLGVRSYYLVLGKAFIFSNGGASLYQWAEEVDPFTETEDTSIKTDFGLWTGPGVVFTVSNWLSLELNGRYNYVFSEPDYSYIEPRFGLNFHFDAVF